VVAGNARSGATHDENVDVDNHDDNRAGRDVDDDDDSSRPMTRASRLGALIFVIVITQVAIFPHLRLFGVVPDLGLIVALAVGYQEGPEAGAIVGFVAGFGFDLFLETPLGLDALTYAIVGYAIGVLESGLFRSPRWLPSFLGAVGGLAGGLLFIGIGVLVGVGAVKGTEAVITISYAALYDALLAPLVFFLVRRVLGRDDRVRDAWSLR
jgi:rod shape-determining protein MreD